MESKARSSFCFIVRLIGKPLYTFPDALLAQSDSRHLGNSACFRFKEHITCGPCRAHRTLEQALGFHFGEQRKNPSKVIAKAVVDVTVAMNPKIKVPPDTTAEPNT
jgi:hypothetical protein